MFKKVLYTLVIVSMLVAAFGVRGVGVQSAEAANSGQWRDGNPPAGGATLPYVNRNVDMTTANGNAAGDQGGCSAVSIFGQYQLSLRSNDPGLGVDTFLRLRVVSTVDTGSYQWTVLVRDAATDVEIACAVAVGGIVDLTVPVADGDDVIVTIANVGFYVPTDAAMDTFVARFVEGGGLIVDMGADTGSTAGRDVFASSTVDDEVYQGVWDDRTAFLDVPDGTYNLGVQDQTGNAEFAAYYPGVTTPGPEVIEPNLDAVIPLTVQFLDETGAATNLNVWITPNDGGLNEDLYLGMTGVAPEALGEKTFRVNPGYLWDVALEFDDDPMNYFMVSLAFNPTLGTLMFDASTAATWVLPELDVDYADGDVEIDPPGALEARWFNFEGTPVPAVCTAGYTCENLVLSANIAFDVTEVEVSRSGWDYYFLPTVNPWNFAVVDFADPAAVPAYNPIFGDTPFETTPIPATSAGLYTLPLAAGEVALGRGPWTDQFGNTITSVLAPDNTEQDCDTSAVITDTGTEKDVIAPCYFLATLVSYDVLANDWATTDLGPVTDVGRYWYEGELQHGDLTGIDGAAGWFGEETIFAIQPADMSMMTDWSWSWVMAMYEYDLTNGLNGGGYAPNAPVTRAQMAAFLARTLDLFGLAPTGAAPAFSDVPASYWASAEIAFLRDYGITAGTDWCNGVAVTNTFCPNANVTRAEMAKFIEVTFRTIKTFAGVDFYWPEEQNIYIHGITFIDVPVDYWANVWVEEFFFDQLTDGCMRDGLNLYFCPGDEVTRGQMAKFIIRAIQPDFVTQGFWPILAPSK